MFCHNVILMDVLSAFLCVCIIFTTLNARVNPTLSDAVWSHWRDLSVDRYAIMANGDTEGSEIKVNNQHQNKLENVCSVVQSKVENRF